MDEAQDAPSAVRRLLIVGGGSAGWMAAAFLSRALGRTVSIELVESEDIGIVGVGEATIPPIREFNRLAGVDEAQFIRATDATFKVGIQFENWGRPGDRYIHAFGHTAQELDALVPLHHWWLLGRGAGRDDYPRWEEMFLGRIAADENRFAIDRKPGSELSRLLPHAYHFDAFAYSRHLRSLAEGRGVTRTEGRIAHCVRESDSGLLSHVVLEDGRELAADFFVDCSGFRSFVLGETMEEKFCDWSHYLPADRAVVVQSEHGGSSIAPYTKAIAHDVGWQWQIPLRSRVGNGHVYSSAFSSDEEAKRRLLPSLVGKAKGEPRLLKFRTGRRANPWSGNVLALGLAAGFLEPLESTSIHLVQSGLERFVRLFPTRPDGVEERQHFNRESEREWLQVRDFIIAHYKVTQREDSEFWLHCAQMQVPDSLAEVLALWEEHGSLAIDGGHLFQSTSWTSLLLGQNLFPERPHPLTGRADAQPIAERIDQIAKSLRQSGSRLPEHSKFIEKVIASACAPKH